MRVERWVLREVVLPLKEPFQTAWGTESARRLIIVEAHGDGLVGYGEVSALSAPFYTEETVDTAWYVLEHFLIPMVLRTPWAEPEDVAQLLSPVRRHFMAKAGLEAAAWDLYSKRAGLPLADLLSRPYAASPSGPRRVPAGAVLGIPSSVNALVAQAEELARSGYRRLKVKIKPGWDEKPLSALRSALGDFPLMADANGSYPFSAAADLQRLDDFSLLMLEQPLAGDGLLDHARLQRLLRTPICLDESITSAREGEEALELGSCRVICIKPARVGGLTEARKLHDLCWRRGVPVWCGGMLESGIGKAHALALATLPGFTLPGDFAASDRYWEEDLVEPAVTLEADGTVVLPRAPGIGWQVRTDLLRALTVREATFRP